jgi:hypothetical protein
MLAIPFFASCMQNFCCWAMCCRPPKVLADVRTKLELLLSLLTQVRMCSCHQIVEADCPSRCWVN